MTRALLALHIPLLSFVDFFLMILRLIGVLRYVVVAPDH